MNGVFDNEEIRYNKVKEENKLLRAKTEAIKSLKSQEELYAAAIKAMRRYAGETVEEDDEDIQ